MINPNLLHLQCHGSTIIPNSHHPCIRDKESVELNVLVFSTRCTDLPTLDRKSVMKYSMHTDNGFNISCLVFTSFF